MLNRSIEKKLDHSRNGTNVYRIKKKRKIPVQLPVEDRKLPTPSPLVSLKNLLNDESIEIAPEKSRRTIPILPTASPLVSLNRFT